MAWNAGPACAGISGRSAWNPHAANQAEFDRAKIRRVLGSATMQVLELK